MARDLRINWPVFKAAIERALNESAFIEIGQRMPKPEELPSFHFPDLYIHVKDGRYVVEFEEVDIKVEYKY